MTKETKDKIGEMAQKHAPLAAGGSSLIAVIVLMVHMGIIGPGGASANDKGAKDAEQDRQIFELQTTIKYELQEIRGELKRLADNRPPGG